MKRQQVSPWVNQNEAVATGQRGIARIRGEQRGWPVVTVSGVTVAVANVTIYYEGSDLTLVKAAVRLLED